MKNTLLLLALLSLTACGTTQKIKYSALEKVGIHKRDVLVDRIEQTTETQKETKEQFKSAYAELAGLVEVKDAGLEKRYKSMAKAVEKSENKADELDDRIASVDEVAQALFKEWQNELSQYQSAGLRRASEQNLQTTKTRYAKIYQKMRTSQKRVEPVLKVLQDNTLYLKHNLNARAITSISSEVLTIEQDVTALIAQMEASINESQSFIRSMRNE